jgi:hypothetical protein
MPMSGTDRARRPRRAACRDGAGRAVGEAARARMTAVLPTRRLLCLVLLTALAVAAVSVDKARAHAPRASSAAVSVRAGEESAAPAPGPLSATPRDGGRRRPPLRAGALALVVATAVAVAGRRRDRAALVLALGLVGHTFETGVHSVHHLGDVTQAARCAVASAASHAPGALEDRAIVPGPLLAVRGLAPLAFQEPPCSAARQPHESRAPPSRPA